MTRKTSDGKRSNWAYSDRYLQRIDKQAEYLADKFFRDTGSRAHVRFEIFMRHLTPFDIERMVRHFFNLGMIFSWESLEPKVKVKSTKKARAKKP